MQLSQSTPTRARRRSAMAVLATVSLVACYGVWATEQAPTAATSSPIAADAQRYEVVIDFKKEVPGKTQTINVVLPMVTGGRAQLFPNAQSLLACKIDFEVISLPNDLVMFKMPFKCDDDNEQREPKLMTALGQKARVQVGKEAPGVKFEYTIDVTVNRWPESKPWPEFKPVP